ncbi:MAG: substrate-binding domain-containing protein [Spirochaetia bacterium]
MKSHTKVLAFATCLILLMIGSAGLAYSQQNSPYLKLQSGNNVVDTLQYKKAPPWKIGFSNASISNEWRVFMVSHLEYEASKYPEISNLYETDAQDSPAKQIKDVEDLLVKGIDCLILSPAVADALSPVVDRVMAKGIPVVVVDRILTTSNWVSVASGDNVTAGRLSMEWLGKQLNGKGNIVMLSGTAGAGPAIQREDGVKEALKNLPGINVLAQEFTDWSVVQGKTKMATLIQKYGNKIDGVWSDSALQGGGAVSAYIDAGLKVPPFTALDDNNRFAKQMVDQKFPAFMISYPTWMGMEAVRLAVDILNGVPVPHIVNCPGFVVTQENVGRYVKPGKADALPLDLKLPDQWIPKQFR